MNLTTTSYDTYDNTYEDEETHLTEVLICLHWLNLWKMVLCTTCTKMVLE